MTAVELGEIYRGYIACLNAQDWPNLPLFVHEQAEHNGRKFGIAGYQAMLEQNFREIPDLRFTIGLLVFDPPVVAARLMFDCTPIGTFLGLAINGRRVTFTENVFYEFRDSRIAKVSSIVDKAAIEAQLGP